LRWVIAARIAKAAPRLAIHASTSLDTPTAVRDERPKCPLLHGVERVSLRKLERAQGEIAHLGRREWQTRSNRRRVLPECLEHHVREIGADHVAVTS
jgi:hypothetical protein